MQIQSTHKYRPFTWTQGLNPKFSWVRYKTNGEIAASHEQDYDPGICGFERIDSSRPGTLLYSECTHMRMVYDSQMYGYSDEAGSSQALRTVYLSPSDRIAKRVSGIPAPSEQLYAQWLPWAQVHAKRVANANFRVPTNPLGGGFDLITFLRELGDVLSAIKRLTGYRRLLKRIAREFGHTKSMMVFLKHIADEHLSWAFGILPLISDIKTIASHLHRFHRVWGDIVKSRRHTFVYVRQKLDEVPPGFQISADPILSDRVDEVDSYISGLSSTEVAGYFKYSFHPTNRDESAHGRFLAMLDNIGAIPNLETIWDAIPFSFVIDWFFDVGELLSTADTSAYPLEMQVHESAIHTRTDVIMSYCLTNKTPGPNTDWAVGANYTFYQREYYLPSEQQLKRMARGLNLSRILIGASLVLGRHRAIY